MITLLVRLEPATWFVSCLFILLCSFLSLLFCEIEGQYSLLLSDTPSNPFFTCCSSNCTFVDHSTHSGSFNGDRTHCGGLYRLCKRIPSRFGLDRVDRPPSIHLSLCGTAIRTPKGTIGYPELHRCEIFLLPGEDKRNYRNVWGYGQELVTGSDKICFVPKSSFVGCGLLIVHSMMNLHLLTLLGTTNRCVHPSVCLFLPSYSACQCLRDSNGRFVVGFSR